MAQYFDRMKAIAETHGGTVEKFIGDAVMVVFGIPRLHDDDAERGVRAAIAMRDAMPTLNAELVVDLRTRIGVNSGEVVTGIDAQQQFLVTGDPVNVAARLQQAAEPGEVMVGQLTERLTAAAIEYALHDPVQAKGKTEAVTAYRAVRARSEVPAQTRGLPSMRAQLVGRERELSLLLDTFARVREERRAHLFTVVGAAGVGKSRLIDEALARIRAGAGVRILRGRCLPYGNGIAYWPLIEMVREDAGIAFADDAGSVRHKLSDRLNALISSASDRRVVEGRLSVLLGLARPADAMPDIDAQRVDAEIAWGIRRYVEALAERDGAVMVVDDLQWAEPTLVEVLQRVLQRTAEVPLLLLAIGRPELLETHRGWGRGIPNASLLSLEPLTSAETTTLFSRLLDVDDLPAELRASVVDRADGNPLFCEEFVRMLIDDGRVQRMGDRWRAVRHGADVRIPDSIQALLAARIDGLAPEEKHLLRVASVVGERFDASDVRTLAARDGAERLERLIDKGFIIEAREGGRERLRFKHILVRDAAYSSLPKSERADIHDRFGRHLESMLGDRLLEHTEMLAHHAERAFTLSTELRLAADVSLPRAARALEWAIRLGERARERGQPATIAMALSVARAAVATAPESAAPDALARIELLDADRLFWAGEYGTAAAAADRAIELALAAGRPDIAGRAATARVRVEGWIREGTAAYDRLLEQARRLQALTDDPATMLDLEFLALRPLIAGGRMHELIERQLRLRDRALLLGDRARAAQMMYRAAGSALTCGRLEDAGHLLSEAFAIADELGLHTIAQARPFYAARFQWLSGDLLQASEIYRAAADASRADGDERTAVRTQGAAALILVDLGRFAEADTILESVIAVSERTGERGTRTEMIASRAQCALALGDVTSADRLLDEAMRTLREDDIYASISIRLQLGPVREAQGRLVESEAALRGALDDARNAEWVDLRLRSLVALAEYLARQGRRGETVELTAEAGRLAADTGMHFVDPRIAGLREQIGA